MASSLLGRGMQWLMTSRLLQFGGATIKKARKNTEVFKDFYTPFRRTIKEIIMTNSALIARSIISFHSRPSYSQSPRWPRAVTRIQQGWSRHPYRRSWACEGWESGEEKEKLYKNGSFRRIIFVEVFIRNSRSCRDFIINSRNFRGFSPFERTNRLWVFFRGRHSRSRFEREMSAPRRHSFQSSWPVKMEIGPTSY